MRFQGMDGKDSAVSSSQLTNVFSVLRLADKAVALGLLSGRGAAEAPERVPVPPGVFLRPPASLAHTA